ncbi:MAG: hypothetical protein MJZ34_04830 [Paludibacteraceae bacterium]|nr:hypothetical protein [Paludibacteraceae bacterium]
MPIYINDNEHALFKGDKDTPVCLLHGNDLSEPNGYYFEVGENNLSLNLTDSNLVNNIDNTNLDDGIVDYRPWLYTDINNVTHIYSYNRNKYFPIYNWTQKGIVRSFKTKLNLNFYVNNGHINIKGSNGGGNKNRRYTIVPINALGEKLFTSSEVNVLNFQKGITDFSSEFYNETRMFSYVAICSEMIDSTIDGSWSSSLGDLYYGINNDIFNAKNTKHNISVYKQIDQKGVDRPSGKNKYKEGYNTLTNSFAITPTDYKDIPPYMWRYTYLIDGTDLHIDKNAFNNYNGHCWCVMHKTFMTNNGESYFDKYIKNKNNFFIYLDYQRYERDVEYSTQTYYVIEEGLNEMIEHYFHGQGTLTTFKNLTDSSMYYSPFNFWGDFNEEKLTYKKSTYPSVEFTLPYLKVWEKKILNVISKFHINAFGNGTKFTYGAKPLGGFYANVCEDLTLYYKLNVGNNWSIGFKTQGTRYPDQYQCDGPSILKQVLFTDEKVVVFMIASSSDFKKYDSIFYNNSNEVYQSTSYIAKKYENYDGGWNLNDMRMRISRNGTTIRTINFSYHFKTDKIYVPNLRKYVDFAFSGMIEESSEGSGENKKYNFVFSYPHIFFTLLNENIITKPTNFEDELYALWDTSTTVGQFIDFERTMPNCYAAIMNYLSQYNIIFSVEYVDEIYSEETIIDFVNNIPYSTDFRGYMYKNMKDYDCIFPPIINIYKTDGSEYEGYNLIDITDSIPTPTPRSVRISIDDIQITRDNS